MGITVNKCTNEFIIHGKEEEYDIYIKSDISFYIIKTIKKTYFCLKGENIKFVLIDTKSLKPYYTSKKDKKRNPNFTRIKIDNLSNKEDYLVNNKWRSFCKILNIEEKDEKIKDAEDPRFWLGKYNLPLKKSSSDINYNPFTKNIYYSKEQTMNCSKACFFY